MPGEHELHDRRSPNNCKCRAFEIFSALILILEHTWLSDFANFAGNSV
jgi:hypothetical protein